MDRIELTDLTVDFRAEEVRRRDGALIELRPRCFEVLRRLAARAGELVTKEELLASCWPGVVVTEESLTQCVSEIRRALGPGGREMIRTVARRGYVLTRPAPPAAAGAPGPSPLIWPSVAVLPFEESSGEPGRGLGRGFAEDVIAELARNRNLGVLARHTSFAAADEQGGGPASFAQRFGVRYLLEGGIRRAGARMVVNARLVDARDSRHVWAERYTFSADAAFTVLDDLAARVAGTIFSEIRDGEKAASLRRPPADLDVYELTLRAYAHLHQLSRDGMLAARAALEQALALDPNYPPALTCLGTLIASDAGMTISGAVGPEALPEAIEMIRRGLAIDPALAIGQQGLGYALFQVGRFDDALLAAERSVALGPGNAEHLAFLGFAQVNVGRYAAGLENVERAIMLNPLGPALNHGIAATALYALDRHEEAVQVAATAAELSPGYTSAYVMGAASLMALARPREAAARIDALLRQSPGFTMQAPRVRHTYARDPKLRARFVGHLIEAGMPE